MDDRTLLEMAAKAHGGVLFHKFMNYAILQTGHEKEGDPVVPWDPLNDDGDALRLAVKLGLRVVTPDTEPTAVADRYPCGPRAGVDAGDDPCAATRRAIVLAAAEIGKSRVSAPGAVEGKE